jgi:hypothetical protein
MKKTLNQGIFLYPCLRKLLKELLIAVIMIDEVQQSTVSGTVTDASSRTPMPGVNVIVKGSTTGALTGIDGKYTLIVPDQNSVLLFSFIGYNTLEQPVSGNTVINVALSATTTSLDEVIVIGYGTQKKSDLTGSVVRVSITGIVRSHCRGECSGDRPGR